MRWLRAVALLPVALLPACGARTGLRAAGDGAVDAPADVPGDAPGDAPDPCATVGPTRPCATVCGAGVETCVGGVFRGCTAPQPRPPGDTVALQGTVRDFLDTHPDMERALIGDDRGIVAPTLGPDRKPVYAAAGSTPTTEGRASFDQWFREAPGVNRAAPLALTLRREGAGLTYALDDAAFFPVDGRLLGNQGRDHNYHFTLELHGEFMYRGGESFTFAGDDDLWAFIAGRLVIDLGGVHSRESATVSLDALGLTRGALYPVDLFFAERHTTGSTIRVATTIAGFDPCR
ncbi:MAG: fibro-slime domain-containing protein [Polyangiales bacterium]